MASHGGTGWPFTRGPLGFCLCSTAGVSRSLINFCGFDKNESGPARGVPVGWGARSLTLSDQTAVRTASAPPLRGAGNAAPRKRPGFVLWRRETCQGPSLRASRFSPRSPLHAPSTPLERHVSRLIGTILSVNVGTSVPKRNMPKERQPNSSPPDFETLFVVYEHRLGRFLAQVVKSRSLAEDLLQETFLAAFRERERIGSIQNVEAWLYGIAYKRALNSLRGWRRSRVAYDRLRDRASEQSSDSLEAIAVRDLLVRHLKPEDRMLLVLRYVHGFSAVELAELTGRSSDAVRQRLSRARADLLRALQAADEAYSDQSLARR